MTLTLIDRIAQEIAQVPWPAPLKSELDAGGGALWRAYQATFGGDHQ